MLLFSYVCFTCQNVIQHFICHFEKKWCSAIEKQNGHERLKLTTIANFHFFLIFKTMIWSTKNMKILLRLILFSRIISNKIIFIQIWNIHKKQNGWRHYCGILEKIIFIQIWNIHKQKNGWRHYCGILEKWSKPPN